MSSQNNPTAPDHHAHALAGIHVLVTRPVHQAGKMCALLSNRGANTIQCPTLEISNPVDTVKVKKLLERLDDFDTIIFISTNAVHKCMEHLNALEFKLPNHITLAAIGQSTAMALQHYELEPDLVPPSPYTTEAFLRMEDVEDMDGAQVLIVRGEGGRETLAKGLSARGADVEYAEVYRRSIPQTDNDAIKRFRASKGLHIVSITSEESLINLQAMVKPADIMWLKKQPLLFGSRRVAEFAVHAGFSGGIILANNPTDDAMVRALLAWHKPQAASA
ncbi:MAG: uroporphyrinogen-III synthase [Gammaproteobacteria bacterium]|nr:MAG: uroporphyrinogen-III synthase [Gammaproteobacteria bacterium]